MMIDNFEEDLKIFTLKVKTSSRNEIGQVSSLYSTSSITGIIAKLRNPREISGTLNKIISDYVFYSDISYTTEKGDLIVDGTNEYEVTEMIKQQGLGGDQAINMHYLQLVK